MKGDEKLWALLNDKLEETMNSPPPDYEIVASNYADLLRALGKARQASHLEERVKKRRR